MSEEAGQNWHAIIRDSFDDLIVLLGTVGHPKRLKILVMLLEEIGLKKSALSSHLGQLREKSIIIYPSHSQYELTDRGRNYLRGLSLLVDDSRNLELTLQRTHVAKSFLDRKHNDSDSLFRYITEYMG
ncbi:MAG: hypothetical protein RTV31_03675 [Candidatus Thorarchaeota archaeon]